jgi:hypothetical protein
MARRAVTLKIDEELLAAAEAEAERPERPALTSSSGPSEITSPKPTTPSSSRSGHGTPSLS